MGGEEEALVLLLRFKDLHRLHPRRHREMVGRFGLYSGLALRCVKGVISGSGTLEGGRIHHDDAGILVSFYYVNYILRVCISMDYS